MSKLQWSFSKYKTFDTCRFKYYRLYVKKDIKDSGNKFTREGEVVHKHLENRVKKGFKLPPTLEHMEPICAMIDKLKAAGGKVDAELKFALDQDLNPVGFFDKNVWVRSILDAIVIRDDKALIIDWKTGKRRPDFDQLDLCAAVTFQNYPDVKEITGAFCWTQGDVRQDKKEYTAEEIDHVWEQWRHKAAQMEHQHDIDMWPKDAGVPCRWCVVGDCPHYETKKQYR